mgnify:CR=1 FL=1
MLIFKEIYKYHLQGLIHRGLTVLNLKGWYKNYQQSIWSSSLIKVTSFVFNKQLLFLESNQSNKKSTSDNNKPPSYKSFVLKVLFHLTLQLINLPLGLKHLQLFNALFGKKCLQNIAINFRDPSLSLYFWEKINFKKKG